MPESRNGMSTVGAVLVVGAGISGMQSALDLAEAGFRVHLVDEAWAIGGTMAQLDKTFPTNDCAMCILSPKLVEAGRHLNIQLHPGTVLERLEGEPGRFRAILRRKARYVDVDKCTACGDCLAPCPVELPNPFDGNLGVRKAIYKLYPQAIPNAFAIEKRGVSPCRKACPAGVNAHAYVALLRSGRIKEAWQVIMRTLPFPSVCGRVCTHPCEEECFRGQVDRPVAIRDLKRAIADWMAEHPDQMELEPCQERLKGRVAVVGAGPAGLTAAYQLARRGVSVTVFEALPVLGGMMRVGIPAFRLPREVLDREIRFILSLGIEVRLNSALGRDFTLDELFEDGYQSIIVATGAHVSQRAGLPGEELEGVFHGVDFLRSVNLGRSPRLGGRVAVIGGGNTALDAARTALRLGAESVCVYYRRSRAEMPASDEEVEQARAEGVQFSFLCSPVALVGRNGRVTQLRLVRNRLAEPDASGRRRPVPVEGSEYHVDVDAVILAIGQRPSSEALRQAGLAVDGRGLVVSGPDGRTSREGVYAGGDVTTGPATVVEAVAAGNRVAAAVAAVLRGEVGEQGMGGPNEERRVAPFPADVVPVPRERARPRELPPGVRRTNFDEVVGGLSLEEAVAEAERCLNCGGCSECLQCVPACRPAAIDHHQEDQLEEIEVGAVILSAGFELFDARLKGEYGFGRYPNVITSMQFERMLSASGPWEGHVRRPSDGRPPRRIAFIQCVGSRDLRGGYRHCSGVCCMYTAKEAIIAKEHVPGLEVTVFCMDVRAYGKEFERYYQRAQEEYGVRYVRSMVASVKEIPDSRNLLLRYSTEDGQLREEEFDLVVLAVGIRPSSAGVETARRLGVQTDEDGLLRTRELEPGLTSRPGVFVAGALAGPKDIPETVTEASAVAALAAAQLAEARGQLAREPRYPPERSVEGEPPRVGVFVCHCGINIAGTVDVEAVVEHARGLPDVVWAEDLLFTCSQDSIALIKERVGEHQLNRVVVASCTPRTHEPLFQNTIREAGLNPHLFEMTNIREQSSWVHRELPERATDKACDLVSMAVAKARLLRPVPARHFEVDPRALVIGGGLAGMTASLCLAAQGFEVYLVERERELGGMARRVKYTVGGDDPSGLVDRLIGEVLGNPRIRVYLNHQVEETAGYVGNYVTVLRGGDDSRRTEIRHGAVIIATGAREATTDQYLYGRHPRVVTQLELEEMLASGKLAGCRVVMIQCVGSRTPQRPYCSRICCAEAVKNAVRIRERYPASSVVIFYRDIRTYGLLEEHYRRARERGVLFIRYDPEQPPEVRPDGDQLLVCGRDPATGWSLEMEADLLVLSPGVEPQDGTIQLSRLFKLPLTEDGFFAEAHMKLRPVDFAADGVYLCGLAHGPKLMQESITQARAAAMRAAVLLGKGRLEARGIVAYVRERACSGCGLCVKSCPYDARQIDPESKKARVTEVLCQGCGACVVACPNGASQQAGFSKEQILAMVEAALR